MMYSYWGIATSLILTSCLWMLLSMDYKDDDILGSVSSAHLVRRGYPFTYVTHLCILPLTPLYLHLSHFAIALLIFHFESTFFNHPVGSYPTLLIRGEDVGQFWVFWLSVRIPLDIRFGIFHDVGPIRLMMCLRWCLHIGSWYVVSWPACVVDLYVFFDICFVHNFGLPLLAQFLWCIVLFEHLMIEVRLFHCIIIEHILKCLVCWHSVSYRSPSHTGSYLLLEFIGSSTDILGTGFACCYLRVFILGCTFFIGIFHLVILVTSVHDVDHRFDSPFTLVS